MNFLITLQVPATSANLGAGFDALGLALQYYNTIQMEESDQIEISAPDTPNVPTDEKNLIEIRAKDEVFEPLNLTPNESAQFMFKTVIMFPILIICFWLSFRISKKIVGKK